MTRPISMLKKWIAPLHVYDFTEKTLHYLAQYSLDAYKVPLGISEFNGIKFLPEAFKSSLPSIEALENELKHK